MYLGDDVEYEGTKYPMAGVLPLSTCLCAKPQGLGYTAGKIIQENIFFPVGTEIIGHEFHYSLCISRTDSNPFYALKLSRGKGMADGFDGMIKNNVYAGYNHIHALGAPCWAGNFVKAALRFKKEKK
jgi:cobyrinic acid a,c-diamide synthase